MFKLIIAIVVIIILTIVGIIIGAVLEEKYLIITVVLVGVCLVTIIAIKLVKKIRKRNSNVSQNNWSYDVNERSIIQPLIESINAYCRNDTLAIPPVLFELAIKIKKEKIPIVDDMEQTQMNLIKLKNFMESIKQGNYDYKENCITIKAFKIFLTNFQIFSESFFQPLLVKYLELRKNRENFKKYLRSEESFPNEYILEGKENICDFLTGFTMEAIKHGCPGIDVSKSVMYVLGTVLNNCTPVLKENFGSDDYIKNGFGFIESIYEVFYLKRMRYIFNDYRGIKLILLNFGKLVPVSEISVENAFKKNFSIIENEFVDATLSLPKTTKDKTRKTKIFLKQISHQQREIPPMLSLCCKFIESTYNDNKCSEIWSSMFLNTEISDNVDLTLARFYGITDIFYPLAFPQIMLLFLEDIKFYLLKPIFLRIVFEIWTFQFPPIEEINKIFVEGGQSLNNSIIEESKAIFIYLVHLFDRIGARMDFENVFSCLGPFVFRNAEGIKPKNMLFDVFSRKLLEFMYTENSETFERDKNDDKEIFY